MNTKLNKPTIAVEGVAIGFFPPARAETSPQQVQTEAPAANLPALSAKSYGLQNSPDHRYRQLSCADKLDLVVDTAAITWYSTKVGRRDIKVMPAKSNVATTRANLQSDSGAQSTVPEEKRRAGFVRISAHCDHCVRKIKMQQVFAILAVALLAAACVGFIPVTKDDLQKLQDNQTLLEGELAKKANEADVKEALQKQGVTINKVADKADNALKNAAATNESVRVLGKSVDTLIAEQEKSLTVVHGARAPQKTPIGYAAGLEDKPSIDKNKKLLRLSGFPSAKMDRMGGLAACDELSGPMQGLIKDIAVLATSGWDVREIVGFADDRLSKKLGGVCAGKRAKAIAEALKLGPGLTSGRVTTTFGGQDVSRSVLVYLERTTPAAKAEPAAKSTTASAASAPAASAAVGAAK